MIIAYPCGWLRWLFSGSVAFLFLLTMFIQTHAMRVTFEAVEVLEQSLLDVKQGEGLLLR
jgi:hypothetical protein